MKKRFLLGAVLVLLVATFIVGCKIITGPKNTKAALSVPISDKTEARYTEHYVVCGESLWSIAETYMDDYTPYKDIREYVYQLKNLNKLNSDKIQVGKCILVPYWTSKES